ncbi:(4Fe-4S)-binding protein [Sediminibacterium soli]|uniref:(4Fe-4S)-binding protein n=1 Tax=Sediminibacterium soli TaxID=2698829 RepID=UPI00137A344E|nr:(4Fe-4S)-binding protein [Sediminibacterium soli]NCI45457.1 hypothetical protein [Sediminibacterium soli]
MPVTKHNYTNNEVTVVWKPDTCIHSRICWKGLLSVFNPAKRPWIDMGAEPTDRIIEQVKQCPSGALTYYLNKETGNEMPVQPETIAPVLGVEVQPDGPIIITTDCRIRHSNGDTETRQGKTALCRCGASANKPYCDGSHKTGHFKG